MRLILITSVLIAMSALIATFIVTLLLLQCRNADAPQYTPGGVAWVSVN